MKITPLEIRQKTFEKNFRGYDKDEVSGYLLSLSQEWEKLLDENKELSIKLKASEREVEKLREVENSLFKTLKTAEDTGANIMEQANKAAELHIRETELKAEAILNDARTKSRNMIEEAEMNSRESYEEMEAKVKTLAKLYHTLENLRDDLLSGIKSITSEINEKANRASKQVERFDVDKQLMEIRKISVQSSSKRNKQGEPLQEKTVHLPETTATKIEEERKPEPQKIESNSMNGSGKGSENSFFDEIE